MSFGTGVRVGILDHCFATTKYQSLYASGRDFASNPDSLQEIESHGYWMACVLREIAPACDIYALNVGDRVPDRFAEAIIKAIDWAIENNIRILTCSHGKYVYDAKRTDVDAAVSRAVTHGIVTSFLHYDHPDNILPFGIYPYNGKEYNRTPDINVWHYDYNTLFVRQYQDLIKATDTPRSGNDIPYFSMSSTAAVTGGFVSLLMALEPDLPAGQYRDLLIDTSHPWTYNGTATFEQGEVPRVVDIAAAVHQLRSGKI